MIFCRVTSLLCPHSNSALGGFSLAALSLRFTTSDMGLCASSLDSKNGKQVRACPSRVICSFLQSSSAPPVRPVLVPLQSISPEVDKARKEKFAGFHEVVQGPEPAPPFEIPLASPSQFTFYAHQVYPEAVSESSDKLGEYDDRSALLSL